MEQNSGEGSAFVGEKHNPLKMASKTQPRNQQDDIMTRKILTSAVLYLGYFGLAAIQGVFGPSLLHLALLLDTDIKSLGTVFGVSKLGYMAGAVINGLLVDRLDRNLLLCPGDLVVGVLMILIPWTRHIVIFASIYLVLNFCFGFLNSGTQTSMLGLWRGTKESGPTFQALHGIWGIGAAVTPFVIAPFLAPLQDTTADNSTSTGDYNATSTATLSVHVELEKYNDTGADSSLEGNSSINISDLEKISHGYVILASIALLAGFMLMLLFVCFQPRQFFQQKQRKATSPTENVKERRFLRIFLITALVTIIFFDLWMEEICQVYLTAIAVKGFHWPIHHGSWLTSVFFGFLCLGRLLGIPLSRVIHPAKLMLASLTLTLFAYTLMANAHRMVDLVLWLSAGLAGLALSTTYAAAVDLVNRHTHVNGMVMTFMMIACSAGGASCTVLAGYLFQTYSYRHPIYLCIIACVVDLFVLAVLLLVLRFYGKSQLIVTTELDQAQDKEERASLHSTKYIT